MILRVEEVETGEMDERSQDESADRTLGGSQGRDGHVLDRYRSYLQILAEIHLDGRVRAKVSASDVVQRTLIEAWKHVGELESWGVPQQLAWLRKTLSHVLSKVGRDLHRQKRDLARERSLEAALGHSSEVIARSFATEEPSPSEEAMRKELILQVADGLAGLPEAQRRALLLYYLEGRTLEEVGAALGRTSVAAGGLIRRGLKRLRESLGRTQ